MLIILMSLNFLSSDFEEERIVKFFLNNRLFSTETKLTAGEEIKLINDIKTKLLNILFAFSPNLPKQYGCQFESYADNMRCNNNFLEDRECLFKFLNLYKIELLDLIGKMDEERKKKSNNEESLKDEYANIKKHISSYYRVIETIYETIEANKIDNINLVQLNKFSNTFLEKAKRPVEWITDQKDEENEFSNTFLKKTAEWRTVQKNEKNDLLNIFLN